MPVEFPADHPVVQFGRLFLACLLKHHELGKSTTIRSIECTFCDRC